MASSLNQGAANRLDQGAWQELEAATTAPTPTWSMGNVAQYTKEAAITDDTNQFSLGNVLSFLEYEAAIDKKWFKRKSGMINIFFTIEEEEWH